MTRLFFILASVVTAVAVFFSFQNRSSLIEARAAKDEHNSKIKKELGELETVIGDVVTKQTDRKRIEGERDEQRELLESAKRKLASKKSKAESLDAQLKKYQDEFAAYRDQVDQLPDGVSLETLSDDINRLKEKQTEKKDDLALLEKEIMVMEDNHERVTKTKEEKIAYQEARTKSFDVNSLEANVTAVNRDWGFVIVNAGSEAGITNSSSLLVARNNQPIGKLRIISLEPQSLIADIDFEGAYKEKTIIPGDTVMLTKPNE